MGARKNFSINLMTGFSREPGSNVSTARGKVTIREKRRDVTVTAHSDGGGGRRLWHVTALHVPLGFLPLVSEVHMQDCFRWQAAELAILGLEPALEALKL